MKISNNIGIKQYSFLSGNIKKGINSAPQRRELMQDTFQLSTKVNNDNCSNPTQNLYQNPFLSYHSPSFQGESIINKPFSSQITQKDILKKLKNIDIPQNIKDDIISQSNSKEQCAVANKFLSDENLYNNKNMQEKFLNILRNSYNPEIAQAKLDLMDKYILEPKLHKNTNIQEKIGNIIFYSGTEGKLDLIKQYITEPKLHGNPDIQGIIGDILSHSDTQERKSVADKFLSDEKLYNNKNLQEKIGVIINICDTPEKTQAKIDVVDKYISNEKLYNNKNMREKIGDILYFYSAPEQIKAKIDLIDKYTEEEKLYNNKNMQEKIGDILNTCTTPEMAEGSLKLINKYLFEPKLYENKNMQEKIGVIICYYSAPERVQKSIELIDIYTSEPKLHDNTNIQEKIGNILFYSGAEGKLDLIKQYISEPKLYGNPDIQGIIGDILYYSSTQEQKSVADKFLSNEKLYNNENLQKIIRDILRTCDTPEKAKARINVMDKYISNEKLNENTNIQENIGNILNTCTTPEMAEGSLKLINKYLFEPKLYENKNMQEKIGDIIYYYCTPERVQKSIELIDIYTSEPKLHDNTNIQEKIGNILFYSGAEGKLDLIKQYISEPKLYGNPDIQGIIGDILSHSDTQERKSIADKFLSDEKLYNNKNLQEKIGVIINICDTPEKAKAEIDVMDKYISDEKLYNNENLQKIISNILRTCDTPEKAKARIDLMDKYILESKLYNNINMQERIGDILNTCDTPEKAQAKICLMYKYILESELYTNKNVQETIGLIIASANKPETTSDMIRKGEIFSKLISKINNKADFNVAVDFIELYEKKNIYEIPIYEKRNVIDKFVKNNVNLFNMSDELKQAFPLIPQNSEEYCKVLPALVKTLGIETNPLTIQDIGNFNLNIEKLANVLKEISDNEFNNMILTQKYSKDNFIKDTNKRIKKLPKNEQQNVCNLFGFELRKTLTGYTISGYPFNPSGSEKFAGVTNPQAKEVIEKLKEKVIAFTQNNKVSSNIPEIEPVLNDILTTLPELHKLFDNSGSNKLNIMKYSLKVMKKIAENKDFETLHNSDKKIMLLVALLHDITKNENTSDPSHPVESSFDAFYITKKFNLTQDEQLKLYNLIRNHEWLKYVNQKGLPEEETTKRLHSVAFDYQNDNIFGMAKIFTHSELKSISPDNKILPSFREAFYNYAKQIDNYIHELKKTNPILPTTKLPKASEIENKITCVNADCSTNIKGLYKKDGLIIIKYNEVEDWEALGFPKGSISRGIKENDTDTGNIKFIAHGLDEEGQLTNFDAFALPDSDALLSVSYMERPESKYRLFRTQGVLLDVDSKYIYGGGETDSGSGCKKDISEFKKNYTFGGGREGDRKFISDLIKNTLNLNDEDYIKFIEKNQNKSFLEIEPVEAREKLIKQFALINSNTRRGNREYNEMYVSNPKVQGVFAYSSNNKVGKISDFIEHQRGFLKKYAKTNDLPFFVFGD